MVIGPAPVPTPERKREHRRNAVIGGVFYDMHMSMERKKEEEDRRKKTEDWNTANGTEKMVVWRERGRFTRKQESLGIVGFPKPKDFPRKSG